MKNFLTNSKTHIQEDWNDYWIKKKGTLNALYDVIANFYRKIIIKRTLNFYVKRHFLKEYKVLHAGCGSGKVDTDIIDYIQITALDISSEAVDIYKTVNKTKATIVQGSIFQLPFADNTFDGLYNVAVLEHYKEDEIQKILAEFYRVIKPGTKIITFWPPVFGLSVRVLDFAHLFLNKVLKKKIKLHPDEPSCLRSQKHAKEVFEKAGLKIVEYYFGVKDFFTSAAIVANKKNNSFLK